MSKFCQTCGKELDDKAEFCDGCGQAQSTNATQSTPPTGQPTPPVGQPTPPPTAGAYSAEDIEKNKVMAALAYFLFFLPLVACPDSPFGRYHANQGLLLLIVGVICSIILTIIPIIGWILLPFFYIAVAVFAIIGLMNALKGIAKPLPLFGKFQIIK